MPLNEFLRKLYEALIWNRWSKTEVNLEKFNYELIAPIRSSAFKKVFCCHRRDTNQIVFIKEIVINDENEALQSTIIGKLQSPQVCSHENTVRLQRILTWENYVYPVYETFTSDDLCDFIRQPKNCREPEVKDFVYQILSAVAFYHSLWILIGDLKPQHILIDFRSRLLKLADFGLTYPQHITSTPFRYMAPDLLLGSCACSLAADIWSVGYIFGEMVTGRVVFEEIMRGFRGKSKMDQLRAIFRLLGTPSKDSWPGVTELCSSISSFPEFEPMDSATKSHGLAPEGLDLLSGSFILLLGRSH